MFKKWVLFSSLFPGDFSSDSVVVASYEQSLYLIEPGKISVRTFQVWFFSYLLLVFILTNSEPSGSIWIGFYQIHVPCPHKRRIYAWLDVIPLQRKGTILAMAFYTHLLITRNCFIVNILIKPANSVWIKLAVNKLQKLWSKVLQYGILQIVAFMSGWTHNGQCFSSPWLSATGGGAGGAPQTTFAPLKFQKSNRTLGTIVYCLKNNGLLSFAPPKFFPAESQSPAG